MGTTPFEKLKHAQTLLASGEAQQALSLAHEVTLSNPSYATAWAMKSAALLQLKRSREAVEGFEKAISFTPNPQAPDWHNLATAYEDNLRLEKAEEAYRQALALDPDYIDSILQLAGLMRDGYRLDESVALLEEALSRQSSNARLVYSLGNSLAQLGEHIGAMQCLDTALELDPTFTDPHFYRAVELLAHGDFEAGLDEYEWRWKTSQAKGAFPPFSGQLWNGEPIGTQTLLVWGEQGLGDNIQFVRYLALLRQKYPEARLAYWCPQVLIPIFSSFAQAQQIALVSREEMHPSQVAGHDFHVALLSLPRLFKTRVDSIPLPVRGLIGVEESLYEQWKKQIVLAEKHRGILHPKLRVGLVYSGNGDFLHASRRNLPLSSLEKWLSVPNIAWHSLQVGSPAGEIILSPWCHTLVDWSHLLSDFSQTAALIAHLDLVITVDTAVAHLAGSMGKSVWMLNRYAGCWRWLRGREDTTWYPSMRLFTQSTPGDWESVIKQILQQLQIRIMPLNIQEEAIRLDTQGRVLRQEGKIDEAIALYDQALTLVPSQWQTLMAKGFALRMKNDLLSAEKCYLQAIEIEPSDAQSHYNLAIILLLQRRYVQGWKEYEWRWKLPGHSRPLKSGKLWRGEPLEGKKILLYQEQGFGDAIQFLRFLPRVQELGADVTVAVRTPLISLFKTSTTASVIDENTFCDTDYHTSLLDLPEILGLEEEGDTAQVLHVDPLLIGEWKEHLAASLKEDTLIKVGIVWSGNPERLRNDHRSMAAEALSPLKGISGMQFISLQPDITPDDRRFLEGWNEFHDYGNRLTDFAQTAALVMNLDLVITVDTSVAHLSAALGKPTWIMVCHDSPWYPMVCHDSPWYPAVRLFRQGNPGGWDRVVEDVVKAILDI